MALFEVFDGRELLIAAHSFVGDVALAVLSVRLQGRKPAVRFTGPRGIATVLDQGVVDDYLEAGRDEIQALVEAL